MKKSIIEKPEFYVIGKTCRTHNGIEMSGDLEQSKIWPVVRDYFQQRQANGIPNRANPGVSICAYTEYESDHTGEYTYVVGEVVTSLEEIPEGFTGFTVPAQTYTVYTNGPAAMPHVLRDVWAYVNSDEGIASEAPRRYIFDFEVYDERATDEQNVVLDVLVGNR